MFIQIAVSTYVLLSTVTSLWVLLHVFLGVTEKRYNMYVLLYCTNQKEIMCHTTPFTKTEFKPHPSVCTTSKVIMYRVTALKRKTLTPNLLYNICPTTTGNKASS
jgi:hypothetical protein